jgi:hypothetical protein
MKTRFRKVWCSSCSTMQFAGECPHPQSAPLEVRPDVNLQAEAQRAEKYYSGSAVVWSAFFKAIGTVIGAIAAPEKTKSKKKRKKKPRAEARA